MPVFKTTQNIFNIPWADEFKEDTTALAPTSSFPNKTTWNGKNQIKLNDIKLWEQIYYKKGSIGIYAAWDPYDEYYIIVHNLFVNTPFGIEEFYGSNAVHDVYNRAAEFGITLNSISS